MSDEKRSSGYLHWSGPAYLIAGNTKHQLNCQVLQTSYDELEIIADTPSILPLWNDRRDDNLRFEIPGSSTSFDVFAVGSSLNMNGEGNLNLHLKRSPVWHQKSDNIYSGRSLIVNFAQYWIGGPNNCNFELRAEGWQLSFIPISERQLLLARSIQTDKYRVTHQVEFAREDHSAFTFADAARLLGSLCFFLSFCRGQWVTTALSVGFDECGETAFEEWGTGRVSPWKDPSSWLDELHGQSIPKFYRAFCEKLEDPSWNDAIRRVVYWSARSDTNNVGPDGGCILLQAALERLAWQVLVNHLRSVPEGKFNSMSAAEQLRKMLIELQIPTEITADLSRLSALGKEKGIDGPSAFAWIRNRLVHPPKGLQASESLPYYEAYCLGKWYLELATLSACGYVGEYSNRLTRKWRGDVEPVPWA